MDMLGIACSSSRLHFEAICRRSRQGWRDSQGSPWDLKLLKDSREDSGLGC